MRKLKLLVVLILAGVIGLAAYAYLGDMAPARQEVRSPLALDQALPATAAPAAPATDAPAADAPADD